MSDRVAVRSRAHGGGSSAGRRLSLPPLLFLQLILPLLVELGIGVPRELLILFLATEGPAALGVGAHDDALVRLDVDVAEFDLARAIRALLGHGGQRARRPVGSLRLRTRREGARRRHLARRRICHFVALWQKLTFDVRYAIKIET